MTWSDSTASKLVINIWLRDLFDQAQDTLQNAEPEARDIAFFAIVSGHEAAIRALFASELINRVLDQEIISMIKRVDVCDIFVHTHRHKIKIQSEQTKLSTKRAP